MEQKKKLLSLGKVNPRNIHRNSCWKISSLIFQLNLFKHSNEVIGIPMKQNILI
jgi:hypothetical protein